MPSQPSGKMEGHAGAGMENSGQAVSDHTLFTKARTHNKWLDRPIAEETLRQLYDLLKMGPTSANCSPARFVFVRSKEAKEKLRPALSRGNTDKTMAAPVTAIV